MSVIPPGKKNSMSRLQRKCMFASLTAHGLLLALLVVSSAFVKAPSKQEPVHFVKIFRDSKITDDATQGGGNPNVPSDATPPPAQPIVQPPAQPLVQEPLPKIETPPTPKVQRVEPPPQTKETKQEKKKQPKQETPKITENKNAKRIIPKPNLTEKPQDAPKPPKHEIEVNLDIKKATPDPNVEKLKQERLRAAKEERLRQEKERQAQERARQEAIDQANREYKRTMEALGNIVGKVENKMSTGVSIDAPGPGGEAFINYADLIWTKYYQAWQTPEARDVRNPVRVEIVVAKDGRVISANIIKPSGDSQLDRSVRQALDRVSKLPAFPPGATDPQRTFRINFELKSKRQFG
jgi:TonB family protein